MKNANIMLIEKFLRLATVLVIISQMAKKIPSEDFGLFTYSLAFFSLFHSLVFLGLPPILKKYINRNPLKRVSYSREVFSLYLLINLSLFTLYYFSISFFHPSEKIFYAFCLIFLTRPFQIIEQIIEVKSTMEKVFKVRMVTFFIATTLKIYFLTTNRNINYFIITAVFEYLFPDILYLFLSRKVIRGIFKFKITKNSLFLLKEGLPNAFAEILFITHLNIDQVMLKNLVGNTAGVSYFLAIKVSESLYFIPLVLSVPFFRVLTKKDVTKDNPYFQLSFSSFTLVFFLILPFALFLVPKLIPLVYGPKYNNISSVINIHFWTLLFLFWEKAQNIWDVHFKLLKISMIRQLMGVILNIGLNFYLIPKYFEIGAATSTLLSFFFAYVFSNVFFKDTRKIILFQLRSLNLYKSIKVIFNNRSFFTRG